MRAWRRMLYRAYIDESGNHNWTPKSGEGNRYLCLQAVFVRQEQYLVLSSDLNSLKEKYFGSDPDTPVIFHREDIIGRRGIFDRFADRQLRDAFNRDLVTFYKTHLYKLVSVVIDKKQHHEKYGDGASHPYHFSLEAVIERFALFLRKRGAIGEVFVESRGKSEDNLLSEEWRRLRTDGTRFVPPALLGSLMPETTLHFRDKSANVVGIQIADLLANTLACDVLIEFGHKDRFKTQLDQIIADAVQSKYDRCDVTRTCRGWGKVLLSGEEIQ